MGLSRRSLPRWSKTLVYQELADDAAEGGIGYLVCSFIPVDSLDQIKGGAVSVE
jgi:hypothetical protein